MAVDRGSGASAWISRTSGAFTWHWAQKSRAWQVAQFGDTSQCPPAGGLAACPCPFSVRKSLASWLAGTSNLAIRSRGRVVASASVRWQVAQAVSAAARCFSGSW